MTKIIAINGSPRGKEGNTFAMVESFLKGAKSAGAETEHILLAEKRSITASDVSPAGLKRRAYAYSRTTWLRCWKISNAT